MHFVAGLGVCLVKGKLGLLARHAALLGSAANTAAVYARGGRRGARRGDPGRLADSGVQSDVCCRSAAALPQPLIE